jgi:hypothetical protein
MIAVAATVTEIQAQQPWRREQPVLLEIVPEIMM